MQEARKHEVLSPHKPKSIAGHLLACGSIRIDLDQPFRWSSGRSSPIYIDCRRVMSFVQERAAILAAFEAYLRPLCDKNTLLAGGESGGIPYAAMLAERLGLPMVYVRKAKKGYGLDRMLEGATGDCRRAILIEDHTTDGGSKKHFIEVLRHAGLVCEHIAVIFSYKTSLLEARMQAMGVHLHALCGYGDVEKVAIESRAVDAGTSRQIT